MLLQVNDALVLRVYFSFPRRSRLPSTTTIPRRSWIEGESKLPGFNGTKMLPERMYRPHKTILFLRNIFIFYFFFQNLDEEAFAICVCSQTNGTPLVWNRQKAHRQKHG